MAQFVPAPRLVGVETNPGPSPRPNIRGRHTDQFTKGLIVGMHLEGSSERKIQKKLGGPSRTTIRHTSKRYEETGAVETHHRGGRKRKVTDNEAKSLIKKAKQGKKSRQLAEEYTKQTGEEVSARTIRRVLRRGGLAYMKRKKKPKLTEANKTQRVVYARTMRGYDWRNVLWSDEKTFYLGTEETMCWQDKKDPQEYEVSLRPLKINVWGAIGYYFKTPLYFFKENLNAKGYIKILKSRLPPYLMDCPPERSAGWIFMQDGASAHTARESMAYLDKVAPDRIQNHPPNEPRF
jgi:transposase